MPTGRWYVSSRRSWSCRSSNGWSSTSATMTRMPYGEIARVLGQREETLKVNYHHAVQKLKEKLTREL